LSASDFSPFIRRQPGDAFLLLLRFVTFDATAFFLFSHTFRVETPHQLVDFFAILQKQANAELSDRRKRKSSVREIGWNLILSFLLE
jgi:hypothetical protein